MLQSIRRAGLSAGLMFAVACGDDGTGSTPGPDGGGEAGQSGSDGGAGTGGGGGGAITALEGSCPDGFTPAAGSNTSFPSDDVERRFHLLVPEEMGSPRPVFVSLTGTVQQELAFASQSGLDQLTDLGWIVIAPFRRCSAEGRNCNTAGGAGSGDGRVWEPWYDGTMPKSDDAGPDVRFVEAAVRCVARDFPVDADRIYVGGISAGGTFANRNLTFNSDFIAGGVPASGNWNYGVDPATPTPMPGGIVIQVWGGETDVWPLDSPIANYAPETRAAGLFYAAQASVVSVSCTGSHGHTWPANANLEPPFSGKSLVLGNEFTEWAAELLRSHPRGSQPEDFVLTEPPPDFSCVLGAYTDH